MATFDALYVRRSLNSPVSAEVSPSPMRDVLPSRVELDIVRVVDTPEATHIRYRVRH